MQAPVQSPVCGSVEACTVRYVLHTRIVRVLNKFCNRSERIIQSIFVVIVKIIAVKVIFMHGT